MSILKDDERKGKNEEGRRLLEETEPRNRNSWNENNGNSMKRRMAEWKDEKNKLGSNNNRNTNGGKGLQINVKIEVKI